MRHSSGIVLIVLLVFLSSCKFFTGKGSGKKEKALAVMMARYDSIRVADSIRSVQDRLMAIDAAKRDSVSKADEERLAMGSKYNIIVGSFITPQYAKDLATEYSKLGYNTQIVKMKDSRFELVAAEGHKSFKKAAERLNAFQDTVLIDSWIYIKN